MRNFYPSLLLLLLLLAAPLAYAQDAETPLFPGLEQALYQDAAHAYDDAAVLVLGQKTVPRLQSRLIPVMQGDVIELETYVHYTRGKAKTWQKVGAAAAGLAISSLPYMLNTGQSAEGSSNDGWLRKAAPLVGAGIASLPFVLNRGHNKPIGREFSSPKTNNGLFVPNAYLRYKLYDTEGQLLKSEMQIIDKQAKDAWQRLSLQHKVVQDGFILVELGNDSRRPVWIDGLDVQVKASSIIAGELPDTVSTNIPSDSTTIETKDSQKVGEIPASNNIDGGGDCVINCDDESGKKGDDGTVWIIILDNLVFTAAPISGNPSSGSTYIGSAGGLAAYNYNPKEDETRANSYNSYPEGNYIAVENPGKKDWNKMTNSQRATHILKAIKYSQAVGHIVDLNKYFLNLPKAGNSGFGKQYRITTTIKINGVSIPIVMEIPIISSERKFGPNYINAPYAVGPSGPQRNYTFGLGN